MRPSADCRLRVPAARSPETNAAPVVARRRSPGTATARQFAPISAELPARVRLAAWYFQVNGAFTLLLVTVGAIAVPLRLGPFAGVHLSVFAVLLRALVGIGWLWTGRSLAAGERRGAVVAGLALVIPLIARAAGQPIPTSDLVLGALGAVAVFSAWNDLRDGGWGDEA